MRSFCTYRKDVQQKINKAEESSHRKSLHCKLIQTPMAQSKLKDLASIRARINIYMNIHINIYMSIYINIYISLYINIYP